MAGETGRVDRTERGIGEGEFHRWNVWVDIGCIGL